MDCFVRKSKASPQSALSHSLVINPIFQIQAAEFTATGSLSFLNSWQPVLTNPTQQIAKESPTGYKEAFDLGYRLRTRYPKLYDVGSPFVSWANLYPRVVETAQNFVRGFLGAQSATLGTVVTVNSTGSPQALFDSLGPSDMCPNFKDGNGGTNCTRVFSPIFCLV
jgi:acid phosphatase